jgi:hypothetical protein
LLFTHCSYGWAFMLGFLGGIPRKRQCPERR